MNKISRAPILSIIAMMSLMWAGSCKPKNAGNAVTGDAASKAYVAPGKYDEFYNFVSGGFSGQLSVLWITFRAFIQGYSGIFGRPGKRIWLQ